MVSLPSIEYFLCILRTCRTNRFRRHALHLSAYIRKGGLEPHVSLHNCLILMMLDVACVSQAQQLLDKFGSWDDYLWNAIVAGYAKIGDIRSALGLYEAAKEDATFYATSYTFVALLKACINMEDVEIGRKLHSDIAHMGLLEHDVFVGSTLIAMYIKFGFLAKAEEVFSKLLVREEGIFLDAHTYVCALQACAHLKAIPKGRELHAGVTKLGFMGEDTFVGSALVDMYLKCGLLAEARQVFSELSVRDVVTWTALIMGYADHGYVQDAFDSFKEMQQQGISPNGHTFVFLLSACGSMGVTARGHEVYHSIVCFGLEGELIISNGLIDMFTKCGPLKEAQAIFDKSPKDVVSWTTLITGYTQLGEVENALRTFDRMIGEGVKPDILTFHIVLNACSHTGLMEMAQAYFYAINSHYNFVPTLQHYNCIVDLLGRANHIDKALSVIEIMPLHPGIVLWHSVLGACRKLGDLETARHAFEHAVHLDDADVGAYVCLSNMLEDAALQKEAIQV